MARAFVKISCVLALVLGQADAHSGPRTFMRNQQMVLNRLSVLMGPQVGSSGISADALAATLSQVDGTADAPSPAAAPGPAPDGGPGGGDAMGGGDGGGLGGAGFSLGLGQETSDDAACNAAPLDGMFCADDGSSSFVDVEGVMYDASTGIFSGTLITNLCNAVELSGDEVPLDVPIPSCLTQTLPAVTETPSGSPLIGTAGWTWFGEQIYNSLEAGFPVGNGAAPCATSFCDEGITLLECAQQIYATCEFPEDNEEIELLNSCGGHATPYHYHEDLVCHYDSSQPGHSPILGVMLDGRGLYGLNEDTGERAKLDACNGHFGTVPANETIGVESTCVYHYHTSDDAPFLTACFGPVASVADCKELYDAGEMACLDGTEDILQATEPGAEIETLTIDAWCTCYRQDPETLASCTPGDFYPLASTTDAAAPVSATGTGTDGAAAPAGASSTAHDFVGLGSMCLLLAALALAA